MIVMKAGNNRWTWIEAMLVNRLILQIEEMIKLIERL